MTLNKCHKPVLFFMKHIATWAPQGSIIIDRTSRTRKTGVSFLFCYLGISEISMTLLYCSATCQVAASFLGRANYTEISKMEVDGEFCPYHVIIIDNDDAQVRGSEIRLRNCLKEDPCDEVFVEKAGIFYQYDPPGYYGFFKGIKYLSTRYIVFPNFIIIHFPLIAEKSEVRKALNHIRRKTWHYGNEFLPMKTS